MSVKLYKLPINCRLYNHLSPIALIAILIMILPPYQTLLTHKELICVKELSPTR